MRPYEILSRYYSEDWGDFGKQYTALVSWLESAHHCSIRSIVDVACGIGSLLIELELRGYEVIGIDLSPEMIEQAKQANPNITYVVGDMATAVIPKPTDLAICSFDSLNYLIDHHHLVKALKNIRNMIKPRGFFMFDVNTPFLYERHYHGVIERVVNGTRYQIFRSYDRQQRLATTLFDFGEEQQELHVQRAYSIEEMKTRLHTAGFDTLHTYNDFNLSAITSSTFKAIFVAQRQS